MLYSGIHLPPGAGFIARGYRVPRRTSQARLQGGVDERKLQGIKLQFAVKAANWDSRIHFVQPPPYPLPGFNHHDRRSSSRGSQEIERVHHGLLSCLKKWEAVSCLFDVYPARSQNYRRGLLLLGIIVGNTGFERSLPSLMWGEGHPLGCLPKQLTAKVNLSPINLTLS